MSARVPSKQLGTIVTLSKSETYKETIKEKSTILPYSIHTQYGTRTVRGLYSISLTVQYPWYSRGTVSLYVSDLPDVTKGTVEPPAPGVAEQDRCRSTASQPRGMADAALENKQGIVF